MYLRTYQEEAVNALLSHVQYSQGNPCVSIPTGGGKSIILAEFIRVCQEKWEGIRVIVLAHVQELVQQNKDKMLMVLPKADVGIYSAGLKSRDTEPDILFAGIQSVYSKTYTDIGGKDLIIIDEAHRIPHDGEGMYRQFLTDQWKLQTSKNRQPRIVGLTATPFRMKSGLLCGPGEILNEIVYEANIQSLISDGYLSKPVSEKTTHRVKLNNVRTQAGDYVGADLDLLFATDDLVNHHAQEILEAGEGRKGWLVFCSGINHAEKITEALEDLGVSVGLVHSQITKESRAKILKEFSEKKIKCIVNVSVLTEGFDAPHIDLIALLRPTKSAGLYSQMCGRGLRVAEGKEDCLILDFGQNISRHGALDNIRVEKRDSGEGDAPIKTCPECGFSDVPASARYCPECDFYFEFTETVLNANASKDKILSEAKWHEVDRVRYEHHYNKFKGTETMRVDYVCGLRKFSEWVCFQHTGYARLKAEQWWNKCCENDREPPENVIDAVEAGQSGGLLEPIAVLVHEHGKFPSVLESKFI